MAPMATDSYFAGPWKRSRKPTFRLESVLPSLRIRGRSLHWVCMGNTAWRLLHGLLFARELRKNHSAIANGRIGMSVAGEGLQTLARAANLYEENPPRAVAA